VEEGRGQPTPYRRSNFGIASGIIKGIFTAGLGATVGLAAAAAGLSR